MPPAEPLDVVIPAWLHARSLARGLPVPVPDHGGWRVDTGSAVETCRHVFTCIGPGLVALGEATTAPRVFVKLAGPPDDLLAALPARWRIDSVNRVMAGPGTSTAAALPAGYQIEAEASDTVVAVRIVAADGSLEGHIAASGRAARHAGVFAYDQIVTAAPHRRRGLGSAVMAALARHRRHGDRDLLVATDNGAALYATLGWAVVAPWSTAVIPDA